MTPQNSVRAGPLVYTGPLVTVEEPLDVLYIRYYPPSDMKKIMLVWNFWTGHLNVMSTPFKTKASDVKYF